MRERLFGTEGSQKDALEFLQDEVRKKEEEMARIAEDIERKNLMVKTRKVYHQEFVMSRDRERQTVQLATLSKEMDRMKMEERRGLDLEVLRKSYMNMLLNSYDVEKNVLLDQQERIKQQSELDKRYREMEIVYAQNMHRMNEMGERVKLVLEANAQGLHNQLLENNLADLKTKHELKREIMLGEAAIKFDYIRKKEEVNDLKKRMYQKYQLGKADNMKKHLNNQARKYLEDGDQDGETQDFDHYYTEDEDDAPYLTKMARKAQSKMKDLNYSLSEEDSEINWVEPTFQIRDGLMKPKDLKIQISKDIFIRVTQATNLPENVTITKAEIKLVNMKGKSVLVVESDNNPDPCLSILNFREVQSSFRCHNLLHF